MSDFWNAAMEAAVDARHLASIGRYGGACNRAYFAMFNAARALLSDAQEATEKEVKTHASVLRLFSLKFIRNGPFDPRFGEILREAFDLRALVDYSGEPVSAREALEIMSAMEEFLTIAESVRAKGNRS